jgi:acetyl-CoA acetyltransferase
MKRKPELAIVGIGEVPCGRYPERTPLEIALRASKLAIEDAGINKNQIDAILPAAAMMDNDYNVEMFFGRLPEALGAKGCKVNAVTIAGGASSFALRKTAEGLIRSGEAEVVLVTHAQRFSSFPPEDQINFFAKAGADPEWEIPYGINYNALAGMITQRYMHDTGTTARQIAAVCVSMRKWAMLHPNSMFGRKGELTIESVLNSPMVTTPLTAFMCNVLADGGSAFIMTSAERARKITKTPVYILGEGSCFSHRNLSKCKDLSQMSFFGTAAKKAYEQAGVGPEDIDIAEIYGAYPALTLMLLEEFGFCKRGEAGKFVEDGNTWPGERLPMTTNGEGMSFGHTGTGVGIAILVEAVRQLMGKARKAQVEGAKYVLENCGGGAYMDAHVTILGKEWQ